MLKRSLDRIYRFSYSGACSLLLFLLAYACAILQKPVIGICLLAAYVCLLCICHGDILPIILPLLLIYCLTFFCPDVVWLAFLGFPCGGIFVYRLIKNRRNLRLGHTFWPLVAVTVALMLGGISSITAAEYFSPGSIYIILGLGPMMVALYLLLKSSLGLQRAYDSADYMSGVFYIVAVFVAFLIFQIFLSNPEILFGQNHVVHKLEAIAPWRNGASNLAIMLLPFIFYYARRHSPWHLIPALLVYVVVALAGSRAAIVVGALMMLVGFFYFAHRRPLVILAIVAGMIACCAVGLLLIEPILLFSRDFLCIDFGDFIDFEEDVRYKLLVRALEDFQSSPLFGRGIGYTGNSDLFSLPADNPEASRWRVIWYHSLIPQIIGSMGCVGIFAYGYQFVARLRTMLKARRTAYVGAVVISYVCVLLYSQFDPGLFSPMPFGVITLLLFALLEEQQRCEKKTV